MDTGIPGDFLTRVDNIKVSVVRGNYAVHKPLLLLFALGRVQRREPQFTPFKVIEQELSPSLRTYWIQKGSPEVLDPFWLLQHDLLWEVRCEDRSKLILKKGKQDEPTLTSLREADASGGFPDHYYRQLSQSPELIESAARLLLSKYFQGHLPQRVASDVGLALL